MEENNFKKRLTPEQYRIMRERGTEAPFSGKYWNEHRKGMYQCVACGQELFSSDTKFDSGTGWPSFTDPINREHVELHRDSSHGMERVEVVCKQCGSHLGHVFEDGPVDGSLPARLDKAPAKRAGRQGKRYCINSACLDFKAADKG